MESFEEIYQRAEFRKGPTALKDLLTKPLGREQLKQIPDHRYLAEFTKKVFQSGFVWRVVEQKWPQFEQVFWGFDIDKLLLMPPDMLEQKATDPAIIRNYTKVKSIIDNARMIRDVRHRHGSFGEFIADWPSSEITELWSYLKKHGSRLGGNTGPYALRFIGKDTFLLSRDVELYFRDQKLIEGGITSKRSLSAVQLCFNQWQQQSGKSLQEISRTLAFSWGENYQDN